MVEVYNMDILNPRSQQHAEAIFIKYSKSEPYSHVIKSIYQDVYNALRKEVDKITYTDSEVRLYKEGNIIHSHPLVSSGFGVSLKEKESIKRILRVDEIARSYVSIVSEDEHAITLQINSKPEKSMFIK